MNNVADSCQPSGGGAIDARPVVMRVDHVDLTLPKEGGQIKGNPRSKTGWSIQSGDGPTRCFDLVRQNPARRERYESQAETVAIRMSGKFNKELFQAAHVEAERDMSNLHLIF